MRTNHVPAVNTTTTGQLPYAVQTADHERHSVPVTDGTRLAHQAAAVYVANKIYDEAIATTNPAATLDDISDALPEVMPEVFKTMGTVSGLAEDLLPEVTNRVWAFTVVAHARADVGNGYGYVLDVMADSLRRGADPQAVRAEVPPIVKRLRIDHAIGEATSAITMAVTTALAGLTTHPRDVAERLHTAVDDAQAEHLAHPTVGDMSLGRAEAAEAFSTATYAMERALSLSMDPKGTASGLRTRLGMFIDEQAAAAAKTA
jgi:hypothetical protein